MSTETPAPEPEQPTTETPAETPEAPAQETDWKAMARKWEAQAKANKGAAEKLAEFEESQKTEAQKLADRAAAAEAKAAEYEKREQIAGWKADVSKETGVPAAALAGSTLEELQAHAEILKPLIEKANATPEASPYIVPSEGKSSTAGGLSQLTAEDAKNMSPGQVTEARKQGRFNRLLGIS